MSTHMPLGRPSLHGHFCLLVKVHFSCPSVQSALPALWVGPVNVYFSEEREKSRLIPGSGMGG